MLLTLMIAGMITLGIISLVVAFSHTKQTKRASHNEERINRTYKCPECGWPNFKWLETFMITFTQCTRCKSLSYIDPNKRGDDIQNYEGNIGHIPELLVEDKQ